MKSPMTGWIGFAAIVMVIIGALNAFEGLIAIIRDEYYVVTGSGVLLFDLTTWGWIMLIWGGVLLLAGLALSSGAGWARWFAIILVVVNIFGQLGFVGSAPYPVWSLTVIALNIVVLYALTARWEGFPEQVSPRV